MSDALEKTIDDLTTYLALASSGKQFGVGLNYFTGIEVFLPEAVKIIMAKHADVPIINTRVGLGDVSAFDVSTMGQAVDPSHLFGLTRFRRVSMSQVRGKVSRVLPFMVESGAALVARSGKVLAGDRVIWASPDGLNGWHCVGPSNLPNYRQSMYGDDLVSLRLSLGIHFARDYDWCVHLGYAGCPTINFPTDPTGVLEVFRLRDLPEGKKRRDALLHWVREHWRRRRSDPTAFAKVKEHLRGKTTFVWNGLQCLIKPAPFDLRRLEG